MSATKHHHHDTIEAGMRDIPHIELCKAYALNIQTLEHSWANFTFDKKGNLYMTADWGGENTLSYKWTAYGSDFIGFLKTINSDYLYRCLVRTLKLGPSQRVHIIALCQHFIDGIKVTFPGDIEE